MKVLSCPNKSAYVDICSKLKDDCFDKLPAAEVLFFLEDIDRAYDLLWKARPSRNNTIQ